VSEKAEKIVRFVVVLHFDAVIGVVADASGNPQSLLAERVLVAEYGKPSGRAI
jgi:hypothetical protein